MSCSVFSWATNSTDAGNSTFPLTWSKCVWVLMIVVIGLEVSSPILSMSGCPHPASFVSTSTTPLLVTNAAEAVEADGRLTLRVEGDPHVIQLEVADSGPGISPEDAAHVFVAQDDRAERRDVELGHSVGDRWQILSGVTKDEWVIVTGNEDLDAEAAIQIVELPPPGESSLPSRLEAARPEGSGS